MSSKKVLYWTLGRRNFVPKWGSWWTLVVPILSPIPSVPVTLSFLSTKFVSLGFEVRVSWPVHKVGDEGGVTVNYVYRSIVDLVGS